MAERRRGTKDVGSKWVAVCRRRKPFPFPSFRWDPSKRSHPLVPAAPSPFLRAKAWVTITIQITRQLVTCACLTALINERKTANFASGEHNFIFFLLFFFFFFPPPPPPLREKERKKRARVSRDPAAFVSTRPHSFMLVCKRRRLPLRGCRGLLGRYSVTRS